jgi:hypothetical protein
VNCLTSVFLSPLVCVFGVVYRLPALNLLLLVILQFSCLARSFSNSSWRVNRVG